MMEAQNPVSVSQGSRAVNVSAKPADVEILCRKHAIAISALEALQSGGSRVVLGTLEGADLLRAKMSAQLLNGPVVRSGLYVAQAPRAPHR